MKVPTLAEFKDAYLRHKSGQRLKASTDYARESVLRKHIIPVLGEWRLDEIDTSAVDELKETMEENADLRPSTTSSASSPTWCGSRRT